MPARRWFALNHERRVLLSALAAGLPGVAVSLLLLRVGEYSTKLQVTAGLFVIGGWLAFAYGTRERVGSSLRTLANLLEAMREGDYSIRARGALDGDAMAEVVTQVNAMAATLRTQRLGALEATALLRKVMEEIEVAVFAFDETQRLRLVNRAAERVLAQPLERLLGKEAGTLGLREFLTGAERQTVNQTFPGATGRWQVARSQFREGGLPHQLLVLTDLTRALREEELQAWQRLVRVLGHEIGNSLTPIKSIAGSLERLVTSDEKDQEWEDDMKHGLRIIGSRSEALGRFIGAYSRLAKLPQPRLAPVSLRTLVRHVAGLETRLQAVVLPSPDLIMMADSDQVEQVLINLLRNAVDASLETGGGVSIGWGVQSGECEISVRDEGPGLANSANLFVPFFTTKPQGSGIGLVLSRQIAEAHGGRLSLTNRADRTGCEAKLILPMREM